MIFKTLCYFVLLSLFSQRSDASVSEWVDVFVDNSEVIQSSYQSFFSVQEMKREAKTKFFPSVSLEGAYIEQEIPPALTGGININPPQIYDASLVVEQPIFLGGRIWAGVRQRSAAAAKAKSEYRQKKNEIISEFLDLLFEKYKSEKIVEILKNSQSKYQDFVAATKKRSQLGNVRSFELSQAQSNALAYVPKIRGYQIQAETFALKISSLIPIEKQPSSMGDLFLKVEQVQQLKNRPVPQLSQHPSWMIAMQSEEYAKASKSLALGEHYPSFLCEEDGGIDRSREDLGDSGSNASELRLGVSIPVFSGLSSVYIRRSQQALIKSAELMKEYSKKSLVIERDSTEKNLNAQIQQVQDVDKWRKTAQKALKEGVKNYRLGVIDNFQVVNLQQGLEAAETTYIETLYGLNRAFKFWCIAHGLNLEEVYSK